MNVNNATTGFSNSRGFQEEELFKSGAIFAVNRRFPSNDKITIFNNDDFATSAVMNEMRLIPYKEYSTSRVGTKVAAAYMNEKPCLLRYVELNSNMDSQGDILTYLSVLKSLKHTQLEKVDIVGSIQLGNAGTTRETKIIMISELGQEIAPLSAHIQERPVQPEQYRKCIKLSIDIARGLEHMHQNDIIHGDICASNVFISNQKDWHAILSGYFRSCQAGLSSNVMIGNNVTPNGEVEVELTDDILAFGLLMAEMILGDMAIKQVFNVDVLKQTDMQFRKLIHSKRITVVESKLRKLIPYECPESFEALICLCCHQETHKRPNIGACIDALIEIMEDLDDTNNRTNKSSPESLHRIIVGTSHIGNKRGSIDPRTGPITFAFNSPKAYHTRKESDFMHIPVDSSNSNEDISMKDELNGLQKMTMDTVTAAAAASSTLEKNDLTNNDNNSNTTDVLLHTILEKLESFETRLSAQQDLITQQKTMTQDVQSSSMGSSSSTSSISPSKNEQQQQDESEPQENQPNTNDNKTVQDDSDKIDDADVQEQLDKLNYYVNQAKVVQENLQEKVVKNGNNISPEKEANISAANEELSNVFQSFQGIIDKCSAVSKRTDDVLTSLDNNEGNENNDYIHGSPESQSSRNPSKYLAGLLNGKSLSSLHTGGGSVESVSTGNRQSRLSPSALTNKKNKSKGGESPNHPSLQLNPGSTFTTSMGEGIGIKPDPLDRGFWKSSKTGSVYKASGWMLRPSNDSRLGPKGKSIGSVGTPHICQADSKLLNEFYRADPIELKKQRQAEYQRGVYDKNVPYRHQKTGDFLRYASEPTPISNSSNHYRNGGSGKGTGGTSSFSGSGLALAQPANRPRPESLSSILRHQG